MKVKPRASAGFHRPHNGVLFISFALIALVTGSCAVKGEDRATPPAPATSTLTPLVAEIPSTSRPEARIRSPTVVNLVTSTPPATGTPAPPTPTFFLQVSTSLPETRWEACENAPLSRLHVGERAFVNQEPYLPNRVRTRPGRFFGIVLGQINPGERVEVLEGPACMDGWVWWRVQSMQKDLIGWTAEGDQENYWLVPSAEEGSRSGTPAPRPDCPVNDASFCAFVRELDPFIESGDIDGVLTATQTFRCPGAGESLPTPESNPGVDFEGVCTKWGVSGEGLVGLESTSLDLVRSIWSTYAQPRRKVSALLLPPHPLQEDGESGLPSKPALYIETGDPRWDWVLLLDKVQDGWRVTGFFMVSRDSQTDQVILDGSLPWP